MDPEQIAIVKSTVGVLEERGVELTRYFYKRMLEGDSQVQEFFNPAHLHSGGQQQALAAAICAYANHIDNPGALTTAVELIAHKHVSLLIQPEHYPIVGKHLLASIQEVLGLNADHPVILAWAAAYQQLADIFIETEKNLYQQQKDAQNGWVGFKPLTVTRKVRESDAITSFHFQSSDGGLPTFKPGQYISVRLPASVPFHAVRNYSLSCAPNEETYRISVKREEGGTDSPPGNVSNYLHDNLRVGDTLDIAPPCGEFFLDTEIETDRPLVLLSGGVGITPMVSMLHASLNHLPAREVIFIHAARHSGVHAFRDEVDALAKQHSNLKVRYLYDAPLADGRCHELCHRVGFIDENFLREHVPSKDCDFYFCGPVPFMMNLHQILREWNVSEERLHFEFFGPKRSLQPVTEQVGQLV
jgi:nitric oxide dioxygenase